MNTPAYRGLDKLDPKFREKVEKLLPFMEEKGWFITETYRSATRQRELFNAGFSKTLDSMHRKGLAFDVAHNGEQLYPKNMDTWRELADEAKKCGIDWGYDLWKWDNPHFQDGKLDKVPFWSRSAWRKLMPFLDNPDAFEEATMEKLQWILLKMKKIKEVGPMPMYRLAVMLKQFGILK